ncbi:synaptobrevin domain-containing protein [Ditylenchus destructor]|nr:synaptobrevin domain-containing protein [Ditylenchus destructor]
MESNKEIFLSAVCRYTFIPQSLTAFLFDVIEIATTANVKLPTLDEAVDLILRGAEFSRSGLDSIKLENCTLYYSVALGDTYDLVYLCLAGNALKSHQAQEFLNNVQIWLSNNSQFLGSLSTPISFPAESNSMLKELMMEANRNNVFSTPSSAETGNSGQIPPSRVTQLQQEVSEVKTIMQDNVNRILERGDRLENIDQRTEALHASSQNFKTTARRVQRNMCWKNLKWTIILTVFLCLLVALIIFAILKELGVF